MKAVDKIELYTTSDATQRGLGRNRRKLMKEIVRLIL
jgi:hypothetical protein